MKEEIVLNASPRAETGSSAVNRMRKQGFLPGVIYGQGTPKNVNLDAASFAAMQRHHTSENVLISLQVEGDATHKVLVRDVQHHPLTGSPIHVDLYELSMSKRVTVSIPLEMMGVPIGVTRDGGLMDQLLREVEVDCLPDDILEIIELDVSALEVGDSLTVADLPLDREKYEMITAPGIAVVSVAAARVEEASDGESAEGTSGAEPEVIGGKPDDEE